MKTKIKVFLAIIIGIFEIVYQEYARRYFGINPQLWVFVLYAMVMAGGYWLIYAFGKELEDSQILKKILNKTENSEFFEDFEEDFLLGEEPNNLKRVIKKFQKSRAYERINFIGMTFMSFSLIYALFFFHFFWPSKFMGIMFLLDTMQRFINVILVEEMKNKISNGMEVLLPLFIAVVNLFS